VLRAAGKPYRYVEIKDMGHQLVFMTPAMVQEQLTDIDGFLKTECKPGGL
jgi:dipeptidyl aminopeptidase/acylaminoacyl peptidase